MTGSKYYWVLFFQESVYQRAVAPLVSKFIEDGMHASVLAYGQTGAGKTHTMFGKSEDPGIIPQVCNLENT